MGLDIQSSNQKSKMRIGYPKGYPEISVDIPVDIPVDIHDIQNVSDFIQKSEWTSIWISVWGVGYPWNPELWISWISIWISKEPAPLDMSWIWQQLLNISRMFIIARCPAFRNRTRMTLLIQENSHSPWLPLDTHGPCRGFVPWGMGTWKASIDSSSLSLCQLCLLPEHFTACF